tara:strand:+ start:979 stop:2133 length:1155 start_codon:yes stop_codon:yes gene_type:complete
MPDKFTFSAGSSLPEIQEDVSDEIAFITRSQSPLLVALGFPDGLFDAENIRYEWLEEALNANGTTLTGTHNTVVTTVNVATGTGNRFVAGDIIQVDGSRELMSVTTPAANSLTVVRGIRGTTAESYTAGQLVKRMNNPAIENESAPAASPVNRVRKANFTEIFRDVASVTRSARHVKMLGGIADELDHQVLLVQKDLIRNLAYTVVNGKAQSSNPEGTSAQARTMDGIIQSILGGSDSSTVDAATGSLTESLLNQLLEDMFTKGGQPKLLCAPPQQRRKLSALLQGRQRYQPSDSQLGAVVERFVSDFGELDVLAPDIFIPGDSILVLDPSRIRVGKLGSGPAFEVVDLGVNGLATSKEVVGEFTLEMMNAGDGGHGLIQNLAT